MEMFHPFVTSMDVKMALSFLSRLPVQKHRLDQAEHYTSLVITRS